MKVKYWLVISVHKASPHSIELYEVYRDNPTRPVHYSKIKTIFFLSAIVARFVSEPRENRRTGVLLYASIRVAKHPPEKTNYHCSTFSSA
jgi:hypothetical protein